MAYLIFFVYWLSMLLIVFPGNKLVKKQKSEWQELNDLRKYMRTEEFIRKRDLLLKKYEKS